MNERESHEAVLARQLELGLEECAGHAVPPDRLGEILVAARSEPDRSELQPARALVPVAALMLVAVAVTAMVFFSERQSPRAEGPAMGLRLAQDKPKQDKPKQDKPKQDKPKQDKPKQDKPKQGKPKPDPLRRNPPGVPRDPRVVEPAPGRKRGLPPVRRADPFQPPPPDAAPRAEARLDALQLKFIQQAIRKNRARARGGNFPLLKKGKLGTALQDLAITANKARMAKDLDAAKQVLDELGRKLDEARRQIYLEKQRETGGK